MSIHDPERTRIAGRPTFAGGAVIPAPTVWPREQGGFRIGFMLPVASRSFEAKFFELDAETPLELIDILEAFTLDPEGFLEFSFRNEPHFKPELRREIQRTVSVGVSARTPANVLSVEDLDV